VTAQPGRADGERGATADSIEDIFAAHRRDFAAHLRGLAAYSADFARFGGAPPAPRFEQDWFPRLDAATAYAVVRSRRPRRIVEIGSGHSSRIMARAIADGALRTDLTSIDPQPRAPLSGLPLRHVAKPLQAAPVEVLAALEPGDVLFIDSSHRLTPGSDVELLMTRVLPAAPAGLLVHFHDIFLPGGYPASWGWRNYNEQAAVAALLRGGGWSPVFSSQYVLSRMAAEFARSAAAALPLPAGAFESSLWLEKRR
jgi:predicted O-methyltransferase YrrM